MQPETVATVKIVAPVTAANPHGFIVINEADLTDAHVIFGAKPKAAPAERPKLVLPAKPVPVKD